MLRLKTTALFRKDYKRLRKRGFNLNLLEEVLQLLIEEKPLAEKFRDHALAGKYTGFRECHILPDWLLVYQIDSEMLFLIVSRTGTHSDLF
jgi:mRNA interferase YafQ